MWNGELRFNVNRMIKNLLDGTQNLESYVDDVLGHTKEWKEHMKVLRDFF